MAFLIWGGSLETLQGLAAQEDLVLLQYVCGECVNDWKSSGGPLSKSSSCEASLAQASFDVPICHLALKDPTAGIEIDLKDLDEANRRVRNQLRFHFIERGETFASLGRHVNLQLKFIGIAAAADGRQLGAHLA